MLKLRTTILNNFELILANVMKQINLYQNHDRKILLRNDPKQEKVFTVCSSFWQKHFENAIILDVLCTNLKYEIHERKISTDIHLYGWK